MGTEIPTGGRPPLLMRLALRQERRRAGGKRRLSRLAVAGAVAAGGSVAAGVAAYAYFTTTGSGTGAASAGTSQNLVLSPGTVNANKLYPGGNGDVVITITNPNPFNVSVTSLTLPNTPASAFTNSGLTSPNATCDANGGGGSDPVTWTYTTKTLSGVIVGKNNGTLTLTLTNGVAMSGSADTSCQGAFFKMANVSSVTASQTSATAVTSITQ